MILLEANLKNENKNIQYGSYTINIRPKIPEVQTAVTQT